MRRRRIKAAKVEQTKVENFKEFSWSYKTGDREDDYRIRSQIKYLEESNFEFFWKSLFNIKSATPQKGAKRQSNQNSQRSRKKPKTKQEPEASGGVIEIESSDESELKVVETRGRRSRVVEDISRAEVLVEYGPTVQLTNLDLQRLEFLEFFNDALIHFYCKWLMARLKQSYEPNSTLVKYTINDTQNSNLQTDIQQHNDAAPQIPETEISSESLEEQKTVEHSEHNTPPSGPKPEDPGDDQNATQSNVREDLLASPPPPQIEESIPESIENVQPTSEIRDSEQNHQQQDNHNQQQPHDQQQNQQQASLNELESAETGDEERPGHSFHPSNMILEQRPANQSEQSTERDQQQQAENIEPSGTPPVDLEEAGASTGVSSTQSEQSRTIGCVLDDIHIFTTFFFTKLKSDPSLANWTKDLDLFRKNFLFFPIHQNIHWVLVVVCNVSRLEYAISIPDYEPPKIIEENFELPVMLYLDSLGSGHPLHAYQKIRRFLKLQRQNRFPNERQLTDKEWTNVLPGRSCKVPLQQNNSDCGVFMLEYIERMIEEIANQKFRLPLRRQNWFDPAIVREKRIEMLRLLEDLAWEQRAKSCPIADENSLINGMLDVSDHEHDTVNEIENISIIPIGSCANGDTDVVCLDEFDNVPKSSDEPICIPEHNTSPIDVDSINAVVQ
eukprot:c5394_g1_i2.p1 GENE.c5394_g1_i2~~c5394_g1_i2.p1  ORF type:complete len:731 (+),score=174.13 c5394_g1_i2:181-2193(+)